MSKLAAVTGITSVTIRRFLHGARPDADTARRLAEILGISVHSIYTKGGETHAHDEGQVPNRFRRTGLPIPAATSVS
ncbi:helix-turn-helix domain-containing protein [Lacticaseibacillus sharpeae]|uniref:helix-turn-helix domain-containing protein n=1 Tax=Lacticaseibacillus sharpeae TaxID=1626 RepID=UPI0009E9DD06